MADSTPTPPPDAAAQFNQEWDQAQARYRAGITAGYDPEDADQMYLSPVRDKWDVLKSVPLSMRQNASRELDDAHIHFLQGIQSGYKAKDAENIYLKPAQQKWVAASDLPQPAPKTEASIRTYYENSPAMKNEEADALSQIAGGVPEKQAIEGHPLLLQAPGFNTRWSARYTTALREDNEAKRAADIASTKAAEAQTPEAMLTKAYTTAKRFSLTPPPGIVQAAQKQLGQLENTLTNTPPVVSPPRFTAAPPSSTGTGDPTGENLPTEATGAAPKYSTKYRSIDDVKGAIRSGELSTAEATKILKDQFGLKSRSE